MKSKTIIKILLVGLIVAFAGAVSAEPKAFELPESAVAVASNVYSLGKAHDKASGKEVEGYAIVHKKGNARSNAARAPKAAKCYAVMAAGAKWKVVEGWEVFPGAGLEGTFLLDRLTHSINAWETAAVNTNILGAGSLGIRPVIDPYTLPFRKCQSLVPPQAALGNQIIRFFGLKNQVAVL